MRSCRLWLVALACACAWGPPLRAEFLPDAARAIPLAGSASRDAPVVELAYGPRSQISLGGELGLFRRPGLVWDYRLSAYALTALENGHSYAPPPGEAARFLYGLTFAFATTAPGWLGA